MGYSASSGRDCQALTSSRTASVARLMVSWDSSVPNVRWQVMADVADRHPAVIQADDHAVETGQAPLSLGDQPRLEAAVAVAWDLQRQRPDLGLDRLGRVPVAAVRRAFASRVPTS